MSTENDTKSARASAAHTPEPWHIDPTDAEGRTVSASLCGSGAIAECGLDYSTLERNPGLANAARIVACVNACAGMRDPASEIAELRSLLDEMLATHELREFKGEIITPLQRAAMNRARAALTAK